MQCIVGQTEQVFHTSASICAWQASSDRKEKLWHLEDGLRWKEWHKGMCTQLSCLPKNAQLCTQTPWHPPTHTHTHTHTHTLLGAWVRLFPGKDNFHTTHTDPPPSRLISLVVHCTWHTVTPCANWRIVQFFIRNTAQFCHLKYPLWEHLWQLGYIVLQLKRKGRCREYQTQAQSPNEIGWGGSEDCQEESANSSQVLCTSICMMPFCCHRVHMFCTLVSLRAQTYHDTCLENVPPSRAPNSIPSTLQ